MQRLSLDELKTIQLEILDYVANFCEENNINYFLSAGTLLGCIRHKGYIPWDDDIDIAMLRTDFDKFKSLFNAKQNGRYEFICAELNNKYPYPFGKVLDKNTLLYEPDEKGIKSSINIDIFIFDNAPDDDKMLKRMLARRDCYFLLNTLQYSAIWSKSKLKFILRDIAFLLLKVFPRGFFARKIIENEQLYKNQITSRVGNFSCILGVVCKKEFLSDFIYKEFEGKEYKVPVGYDGWLTAAFGNYMVLPPEEKRVTHHRFEAYRIDGDES